MTPFARLPSALTLLTLAVLRAHAANVVDMLSFGVGHSVSSNNRDVNGWHLSGSDGHMPDVLSDRIILTPPSPGQKRASAWAEKSAPYSEWNLDVHFRAAGPDRGGGNLQIWYVKDGEKEVGSSSVFSVGKFDGLVIVVDQYGSRGGSIRGFLNDGTKSFNTQHSVDHLAFGHCDYAYRNLGLFSQLTVRQTSDAFEVRVDDRDCFKTHKIKLPSGNQFGISAASAETPDSFEVSQFILDATASGSASNPPLPPSQQDNTVKKDTETRAVDETPDKPASDYKDNTAQFEDLHNRLQTVHHQLNSLVHDVESLKMAQEEKYALLVNRYLNPMHDFQDQIYERIKNMEAKLNHLDSKEFKEVVDDIHDALKVNHDSIMYHLPNLNNVQSPKIGFFVFVVCAFQLMLAGSYVIYKKRKNSMPKKYL